MVMPRWGPALTKTPRHCKELQWIMSFLEFVNASSGQAALIEEVTSWLVLRRDLYLHSGKQPHPTG